MGYCGSSHQVGPLSTGKDHTYGEAICPVIFGSYCESSWNSKDNHFGPGTQFIARFWEHFHAALGTQLIRSSAYHPQTDGQTERINQILEDMLRACALTYSHKWDECLPLAEFSYNNSYQESIKMAPFKALYGRR